MPKERIIPIQQTPLGIEQDGSAGMDQGTDPRNYPPEADFMGYDMVVETPYDNEEYGG